MLEPTKTDTPHSNTKKQPQQDSGRGTITIKSNPIPAGWVTHRLENPKNCNTKEVLPLLWRSGTPRQASQPGDPTRDWESPGNLTLKASGIWLQDFHSTGGTETPVLEGTNQTTHTPRPRGKEQQLHRRLNRNHLLGWGSPGEVWVSRGHVQGWDTGGSRLGRSPLV